MMTNIFDPFQIFVKPVGSSCNLNCSYCYYLSKNDNEKKFSKIHSTLLKKYILQHIECSTEDLICFSWHGGEPTLAGLDFYKNVIEIQKKYSPLNKKIINGIQTNGTLLNDEWCKFFAAENFMVGISIDGSEQLHNRYRTFKSGKGSFKSTINGYFLLKKYKVPTEILCVVNADNVKYPIEIYRFFKSLNIQYLTFIPLVNKMNKLRYDVCDNSVPAKAFGNFLIQIFDEWKEKDIGNIKIQIIEETLKTAFNKDHNLCVFKKTCGRVPILEHNGNFYSCDHFFELCNLLGNINSVHVRDMLEITEQIKFGERKFSTLPTKCKTCKVLTMCNGGCLKNRLLEIPNEQYKLNYLCEGYYNFFTHCLPFIESIKTIWIKNKQT